YSPAVKIAAATALAALLGHAATATAGGIATAGNTPAPKLAAGVASAPTAPKPATAGAAAAPVKTAGAAKPAAPRPATGAVPAGTPVDFTLAVRNLARVAACAEGSDVPPYLDARVVAAHCREMDVLMRDWRQRWLSRAKPFLSELVP